MDIYKSGSTSFVAIPKSEQTKNEAIKSANKFFKNKIENLEATSGTVKGDTLTIGKGNMWVISRRKKA